MIRKSAFIGLTIALIAVLIWLALEGRKEEVAQLAPPPKEEIRSVVPSATRAIKPPDLAILEARMELLPPGEEPESEAPAGRTARHQITIRNSGTTAYGDMLLKFSYLARSGRELEAVSKKVSAQVPPAKTVVLEGITLEGVPKEAHRCAVRILYAEIPGEQSPAGDSARR